MLSHVALASISLTRAFPCCAALVLAALLVSFTHFSWAVRTPVIIAADRREARSELGAALCVTQADTCDDDDGDDDDDDDDDGVAGDGDGDGHDENCEVDGDGDDDGEEAVTETETETKK